MNTKTDRIFLIVSTALLWCLAGVETARGNSNIPPINRTGAPGHDSCASCHTSAGSGEVRLDFSGGSAYQPGQRYSLVITVTDPGQRRFGFSMVARDTDQNLVDVGTWLAGSSDTVVHGPQNSHVSHRNAPFENDSHSFEVNWTAPARGVGEVTFYVAANAANGNFSNGAGDHAYTTSMTIGELVPNRPPSFTVPAGTLHATTGLPTPIAGISLSDADAGDGILTVSLSLANGSLHIADSVPGGIGPGGITNNGSASVTLGGTLTELNATFSDPNGVIFQSDAGFAETEILQLLANDNGSTGGGGEQTTSAMITILVSSPPRLSNFHFLPNGDFEITLTGVSGLTYLVEHSPDLENWESQEEVTLATSTATIIDANTTRVRSRFYRARASDP